MIESNTSDLNLPNNGDLKPRFSIFNLKLATGVSLVLNLKCYCVNQISYTAFTSRPAREFDKNTNAVFATKPLQASNSTTFFSTKSTMLSKFLVYLSASTSRFTFRNLLQAFLLFLGNNLKNRYFTMHKPSLYF